MAKSSFTSSLHKGQLNIIEVDEIFLSLLTLSYTYFEERHRIFRHLHMSCVAEVNTALIGALIGAIL